MVSTKFKGKYALTNHVFNSHTVLAVPSGISLDKASRSSLEYLPKSNKASEDVASNMLWTSCLYS